MYKKSFWESHYRKKYTGSTASQKHNSCQECTLIRVPISSKTLEKYFPDYLAVPKIVKKHSKAVEESLKNTDQEGLRAKTQNTELC